MNIDFETKFNYKNPTLSYLQTNPEQKRVYHQTSTKQPYEVNSNNAIELPQVHPITLKPTQTSDKYHQSTIQHLLLNVDNEKGWTEQDISIFNGLWQLETIKDHEQLRKRSQLDTIHQCQNPNCMVCFFQQRTASQSRIPNTNKNDCFQNNINTKVRINPTIYSHTTVLCTQRLINNELHNQDYTGTYDPTLNKSVDYTFGGTRSKSESVLE